MILNEHECYRRDQKIYLKDLSRIMLEDQSKILGDRSQKDNNLLSTSQAELDRKKINTLGFTNSFSESFRDSVLPIKTQMITQETEEDEEDPISSKKKQYIGNQLLSARQQKYPLQISQNRNKSLSDQHDKIFFQEKRNIQNSIEDSSTLISPRKFLEQQQQKQNYNNSVKGPGENDQSQNFRNNQIQFESKKDDKFGISLTQSRSRKSLNDSLFRKDAPISLLLENQIRKHSVENTHSQNASQRGYELQNTQDLYFTTQGSDDDELPPQRILQTKVIQLQSKKESKPAIFIEENRSRKSFNQDMFNKNQELSLQKDDFNIADTGENIFTNNSSRRGNQRQNNTDFNIITDGSDKLKEIVLMKSKRSSIQLDQKNDFMYNNSEKRFISLNDETLRKNESISPPHQDMQKRNSIQHVSPSRQSQRSQEQQYSQNCKTLSQYSNEIDAFDVPQMIKRVSFSQKKDNIPPSNTKEQRVRSLHDEEINDNEPLSAYQGRTKSKSIESDYTQMKFERSKNRNLHTIISVEGEDIISSMNIKKKRDVKPQFKKEETSSYFIQNKPQKGLNDDYFKTNEQSDYDKKKRLSIENLYLQAIQKENQKQGNLPQNQYDQATKIISINDSRKNRFSLK